MVKGRKNAIEIIAKAKGGSRKKSSSQVQPSKKGIKGKIKREINKEISGSNPNSSLRGQKIRMSPYLESLIDPFNKKGARIPDLQCYPSSTFQLIKKFDLTVNAQGIAFAILGTGNSSANSADVNLLKFDTGNLVPAVDANPTNSYIVGIVSSPTSTDTDLLAGTYSQTTAFTLDKWNSTDLTIPNLYSLARFVSGGITAEFTGTGLTSQGKYLAGFVPKRELHRYLSGTLGVDARLTTAKLATIPGSIYDSVNKLEGICQTWKPVDEYDWLYRVVDANDELDFNADISNGLGQMVALVTGGAPGTSISFVCCFNYEAIPISSQAALLNPLASYVDLGDLSHAMNFVQNKPTSYPTASPSEGVSIANPMSSALTKSNFSKKTGEVKHADDGYIEKGFKLFDDLAPLAKLALEMF
jgi:hypothetical protein